MLEGQRLTQQLARAGIPVELGVDAAIATFTEQADLALVGADSVTMGGIVNKLGTTSLALRLTLVSIVISMGALVISELMARRVDERISA